MKKRKAIRRNKKLNCYEIELTQGKWALVDAEDIDRVKKHSWYYNNLNERAESYNPNKKLHLGRFILDIEGDGRSGPQAISQNHNKLDCRRNNLFIAQNRSETLQHSWPKKQATFMPNKN